MSDCCGVNTLRFARDQFSVQSCFVLSCRVFLGSLFSSVQFSSVQFSSVQFSLVFTVCLFICLLSASHFSSSLFPRFLSWRSWSCVLWLLHPCTSLRTKEGSFPLWCCVNTDAWTVGADPPTPYPLCLVEWLEAWLAWSPVPVSILCLELWLPGLFTGRCLCSETLINIWVEPAIESVFFPDNSTKETHLAN